MSTTVPFLSDDTGHDMTTWRSSDDSGIPITVTTPDDPAFVLLLDDHTTTPVVYRRGCFICEDPEFAAMGLPLCRACPECGGHVAADDTRCDDCGADPYEMHQFYAYHPFGEDFAACKETNS
jgi:hypothetical protein